MPIGNRMCFSVDKYSKMKFKLLAFLLVLSGFANGRGDGKVIIPTKYIDWSKDTNFYNVGDKFTKTIYIIRKGLEVFQYSFDGNLVSITQIKPDHDWIYIDTNKKEHIEKQFQLDGLSYFYFDDSTFTLAGVGEYRNNEQRGSWRYFDRKGRLTEYSFDMPIWRRTNYFDTMGNIVKEVDYTTCIKETIKVRDVEYINGQKKVIMNKMYIDTFIMHFMAYYMVVLFFFFFSRIPINYIFYTREGTKFPEYFMLSPKTFVSLFSFWFTNYKPENKRLAKLNNTFFFLIAMGLFFGLILLQIINGDIK